jgi:hypothetical protein
VTGAQLLHCALQGRRPGDDRPDGRTDPMLFSSLGPRSAR